ncbi:methyl-accepting chemotaxis protein [Terrarubrum flagellatum]|uniref:methyl-accepting chemotaxis protein n=1 Tax=Terrirubrum flagellatum TaxID=2895980 RepID=UPI00314501E4
MRRLFQLARSGVGARIYVAIGGVVALTIAASMIASFSFTRVDRTIQSLVDERYPIVELSRDLAQQAAAAVALAPKLADVANDQERAALTARLAESDKRMREIVDELASRGAINRGQFDAMISRLSAEIQKADAATKTRIAIEAEKTARAVALKKAGDLFSLELSADVTEAKFALTMGLDDAIAAAMDKQTDDVRTTLQSLSNRDLAGYGAGLNMLAEGRNMYGLLREALVLDRADLLVPAEFQFRLSYGELTKSLEEADKARPFPKRKTITTTLAAFGLGDDSLFKLRERDFANRKTLASNLSAAGDAARSLYGEIDGVVTGSRTAASDATRSAKSLIAGSSLLLILIGLASVAAAGAIAWFIVRPQIVKRLARLSVATQAIADGRLDAEIDANGSDEIGAVARAVVGFRDAAIEKARIEEQAAEQRRAAGEERARNEQERARNEQMREAGAREVEQVVAMLGDGLARLAEGDLSVEISGACAPEYQKLKDDFNVAIARLRETVTAIVTSTREVASASAELSTSTTDLSLRTEEQAASLEKTAASLEKIAAIVRKNAESAEQANKYAGATRGVADRGSEVVSQAVKAVSRIEESSHKIADIITVIDEIARQTNLLALNAAVEAARAGEAGRGFAVVASEVRSLAQRSSQAASDIKDLILNSSGRVKEGVEFVNSAGSALGEIVGSIRQVADIVSEIVNASAEQASGVEQVHASLSRMDVVTQQNSALVEENAATAKMLEQQAAAMDEQVRFFRLEAQRRSPTGRKAA